MLKTVCSVILQKHMDENCTRIEKEYKMLNKVLPGQLETVGVNHLFVNFLRQWSVNKAAPLPLEVAKVSGVSNGSQ